MGLLHRAAAGSGALLMGGPPEMPGKDCMVETGCVLLFMGGPSERAQWLYTREMGWA